ncbi:helix-turn-helix domain-containing protein [Sulfolobus tengchongensis]|uniref:Helix-turn-helix domain-containing protein n=1 Tax=Sulfolobus tengchongensis TaxID=207809 RepID=A0AAX4L1W5_9CREN
MEKFSVLSVDLLHPNCWTELTAKYNVNIKLLSQEFDNEDIFSSKVMVIGKDSKDLIRELRNNNSIKIIRLDFLDNYGFIMEFIYPKRNSISNLLYEANSLVLSHRIFHGIEKWKIIVKSSLISSLSEKLEKMSNLLSFKKMELEKVENLIDKLTDRNMKFLKIAYDKGLFEYPKNCNLSILSKELGIRPNTLLYHIRKSEKILLEILLDEYYSLL